jgi:hypothetical protein
MSRMKSIFAVLVVAAMASFVPQAHAATSRQLWIAGSSALWQSMAISAYNSGTNTNTTPQAGYTSTCHWTSSTNFNLIDTRLGKNLTDTGAAWVVWSVPHTGGNSAVQDCAAATTANPAVADVWVFSNVDSVVGNHAYFAKLTINSSFGVGSTPPTGGTGAIAQNLFACTPAACTADDSPSQNIWNYLAAGSVVNVAATDIRPEDAAWVMCRANSPLGASTVGTGNGTDHLDGLGYSSATAAQSSGQCAQYNASNSQDLANVFGNAVVSGYPSSTKKANIAAFNISGKDPATNATVPAYTVTPIGAVPIVFIVNHTNGTLSGLTNATDSQLQSAFSGTNCDASAFGGSFSGAINIFLREPLSGTYNTTEANVMRFPTTYGSGPGVSGVSMETNVGTNNPLQGQASACASGAGRRYRAIGTGEEVKSVLNSSSAFGANNADGIGFTFFGYGNVNTIAGQANYSYITIDGIDGIFQTYNTGSGAGVDPGQPASGQLPLNTPCGTGPAAFPCTEQQIWQGGYSFPNVRNGTYRAWSLLRLVATGTVSTYAADLAANAQSYSVNTVPDFVPYKAVKVGTVTIDPGLLVVRSHYLQLDGVGSGLGDGCPTAGGGSIAGCHTPSQTATVEYQSDMGGVIVPTNAGGITPPATIGSACKTLNGVTYCNGTGLGRINNVEAPTGSYVRTF